MPALQTVFTKLNRAFDEEHIDDLAKMAEEFAPGKPLDIAFLVPKNTPLYRAWKAYMAQVPQIFHESVRSAIYCALKAKPPTQITFAWTPSYDHEITVWQAPDTGVTKGGITVMVKGRYPVDAHPLLAGSATALSRPAAKAKKAKPAKARRRRG